MENTKVSKKKICMLLKGHYPYAILTGAMATLPAIFTILAALNNTVFLQNIIDQKYIYAFYAELINLLFWTCAHSTNYLYYVMQNKCAKYALIQYRNEVGEAMSQNETVDIDYYNSAMNNDVTRIEAAVKSLFAIYDGFINALLAIFAMIYVHWGIMLFSIAMFCLSSFLTKIIKKPATKNEMELSKLQKEFLGDSSDVLYGYNVWDAYNVKKTMCKKITSISTDYEGKRNKLNNIKDLLSLLPYYQSTLAQCSLMIFDVIMIIFGFVQSGTVLTVGQLAGTLFNNITSMMSGYTAYIGYESVYQEKISIQEKPMVTTEEITNNDLTINSLSFSYPDKPEVIHQLSQNFEEGKKYLILGESGCGKSTLLKIIFKQLKDYDGTITLGNVNYNQIAKEKLHEIIGYVTQDSYVFNDTVLNNIELGREDDSKKKENAITLSKIDTMRMEDNAKQMSGGQIQRVCLARELYEYHPIVLMDEVANAVDETTAKEIYQTMLNSNRTIIAVAHYLPEGVEEQFDEVIHM